MPKFIIERNIPEVGGWSGETLQKVAQKSNGVLHDLQTGGTTIQWDHSYVVADKIYCVYIAQDKESLLEHARLGGFPADAIHEVKATIDPTTAE